jgi:hypothetical protein
MFVYYVPFECTAYWVLGWRELAPLSKLCAWLWYTSLNIWTTCYVFFIKNFGLSELPTLHIFTHGANCATTSAHILLFVWSLFLMKKESQTHSIVGSVCLSGCNLPHPPPHSCCSLLACMSDGTTFVSTLLQFHQLSGSVFMLSYLLSNGFLNLGCTCLLSWQPVKQLYWQRTHVIEATSGCWPLQIFPHIACSNT